MGFNTNSNTVSVLININTHLIDRIKNSSNLRPPLMNAIVHGDFYVRHLLLNTSKELSGVIDWGDIHLGDIAIDLSIAHSFLPITAHDKFKNAYGEISEDT